MHCHRQARDVDVTWLSDRVVQHPAFELATLDIKGLEATGGRMAATAGLNPGGRS